MLPLCYQSIYPSSSSSHHRHVVATVTSWCHLHVGCGFVIAIVVLPSSSHHCRVVVAVMSLQCLLLRIRTASHAYREYLQTDYDTGSVQNGPGLSRDNPLCLPFIFGSVRKVPDSCTVQENSVADGSASEALQTSCTVQGLCTVHGDVLPSVYCTRSRSPFCVLYMATPHSHTCIKGS